MHASPGFQHCWHTAKNVGANSDMAASQVAFRSPLSIAQQPISVLLFEPGGNSRANILKDHDMLKF